MADRIVLKLTGSPIANPALPSALRPALRGVGLGRSDEFLPDGYVKITSAFDVGKRSRSTPEGVIEKTIQAESDDVVVLEMADGVTVITSAAKLERSLKRVKPEAVQPDGSLKLDALHERAEESRGIIGDTVSDLVVRVFTLTVGDVADPILDAAKRKLAEWLGAKAEDKLQEYSGLGVTWLGTKALMWAIENQLDRKPGLYRWQQGGGPADGSRKSLRYRPGGSRQSRTVARVYSRYGIVDPREFWRSAKSFVQRLGRARSQVRRSDLRF
jgi:hypothetical protein